jgi:hypothetical protein
VKIDPTNPNNEPGIIIYCNKKGTCVLKEVEISVDRNVIKKVAENIL